MQPLISDPKQFGKVAVLMGGEGSEREVSLQTGGRALDALQTQGVDAHGIDMRGNVLDVLTQEKFDRVFFAMHGDEGENGILQAALDTIGMPYTGSGMLACALAMNKFYCKHLWKSLGFATPEFAVLTPGFSPQDIVAQLGLPLFVKPNGGGSSVGISRVETVDALVPAYEMAARYDDCVLAERCITGGEYTVGILGEAELPVIHIETPRAFYDYVAKYEVNTTQYHCPAGLTPDEAETVRQFSVQAFHAIGGTGWGRVDLMRDSEGQNWVIDVNPTPGLSPTSLVPKAAAAIGISFEQLVWHILETSLPAPSRSANQPSLASITG